MALIKNIGIRVRQFLNHVIPYFLIGIICGPGLFEVLE